MSVTLQQLGGRIGATFFHAVPSGVCSMRRDVRAAQLFGETHRIVQERRLDAGKWGTRPEFTDAKHGDVPGFLPGYLP